MLNCLIFLLLAVALYWGCAALSTWITMIVGPGDANGGDWDTLDLEATEQYGGARWAFTRPPLEEEME